jgi:hypothetical protein
MSASKAEAADEFNSRAAGSMPNSSSKRCQAGPAYRTAILLTVCPTLP